MVKLLRRPSPYACAILTLHERLLPRAVITKNDYRREPKHIAIRGPFQLWGCLRWTGCGEFESRAEGFESSRMTTVTKTILAQFWIDGFFLSPFWIGMIIVRQSNDHMRSLLFRSLMVNISLIKTDYAALEPKVKNLEMFIERGNHSKPSFILRKRYPAPIHSYAFDWFYPFNPGGQNAITSMISFNLWQILTYMMLGVRCVRLWKRSSSANHIKLSLSFEGISSKFSFFWINWWHRQQKELIKWPCQQCLH